ncbi:hypothetical protein MVEN_01830300 [Mycena venus]|uniref:Uncharacterized protein n=1 Tax=Mycena venus TaxID=2733690 RepID=A0A8H6XJN2_9AGAR|nr:hypothetical protein MVEN_01830300 [Mycena venus]
MAGFGRRRSLTFSHLSSMLHCSSGPCYRHLKDLMDQGRMYYCLNQLPMSPTAAADYDNHARALKGLEGSEVNAGVDVGNSVDDVSEDSDDSRN